MNKDKNKPILPLYAKKLPAYTHDKSSINKEGFMREQTDEQKLTKNLTNSPPSAPII